MSMTSRESLGAWNAQLTKEKMDTIHHGTYIPVDEVGARGRKAQTSFEINNVVHVLKNREPEEKGKSCFK